MQTYVLLFRGINVGGKNILPMRALTALLEGSGQQNVRTYIQSGNVVLDSQTKPDENLCLTIEKQFGFKPSLIVVDKKKFLSVVAKNPFASAEGKSMHFYFSQQTPKPNGEKITSLITHGEQYQIVDNVLYLYAPEGIGRSKLVANIDSCMGVPVTGRNLNTISKLVSMLSAE